jgi:integrase
VRLLAPLAADLADARTAVGGPADEVPILTPSGETEAWTKDDWGVWRRRRWDKACKLAGMPSAPRPYDLRHSFASLLLAEGKSVHYVARQLGHSPALTLSTYGHLFDEYEDADRINAEHEIKQARHAVMAARRSCAQSVHRAA